jgi:hypothetical protein
VLDKMTIATALRWAALVGLAQAQFPPKPEGLTILKSKIHENVTISYKEVRLNVVQFSLEIVADQLQAWNL